MDYSLANDIRVGSASAPTHRFNNNNIQLNSANALMSVDIIGNELSIDVFSLIVRYVTPRDLIYAPLGKQGYLTSDNKIFGVGKVYVSLYAPWGKEGYKTSDSKVYSLANSSAKDYLTDLTFGTPVWWFCDNGFFVKGYAKSVERVGKFAWKINCVSGIGLLEEKMHTGGLYTGQTVGALVADIIGGSFSYTIANDVSGVTVFGHLPYDTARNNLHRVLFSCGAIVKRGTQSNDYTIGFPNTTETTIPSSRIALGGSVDYQLPSNTVEVTEHSFFKTPVDASVTVFDNSTTVYADHQLVTFKDAPVYDLTPSDGLTVHESNVNYAIVTGYGTLVGKTYAHVQNVIRVSEKADNEPERIKRVNTNELISSVNSNNVARRVLNYCKTAKTVKAKIMLANEGCGVIVSTMDAFGDSIKAIIKKMNVRPTSVKAADVELIDGYVPGDNGNNYTHRVLIESNGTWTVPADVNRIRIVLIGGGQGGTGGQGGEGGYGGDTNYSGYLKWYRNSVGSYVSRGFFYNTAQQIPLGGAGASGGAGGKVIVYDKAVSAGESISVTIGTGGAGGAGGTGGSSDHNTAPTEGAVGQYGTDTTATSSSIGTLSSANGISSSGFYDQATGEVYATTGESGIKGGDGGRTDTATLEGDSGHDGLPGESVGENSGGAGGAGFIGTISLVKNATASGGGGGGAANGANGSNGGPYSNPSFDLDYANGGNGANAVAPAKATYGCGGAGGNGGGGGGNGAGGSMPEDYWEYDTIYPGNGGTGGLGSSGGEGGDGCVIIYY